MPLGARSISAGRPAALDTEPCPVLSGLSVKGITNDCLCPGDCVLHDNGLRNDAKGMPLVWISDSYATLGFRVLSKRYLMLTLCEDAIRERGKVSPDNTGGYFRLVWGHGISDFEFRRYAQEFWELSIQDSERSLFPEWLLQNVDQGWMSEIPAASEANVYQTNTTYVQHLIGELGNSGGTVLEELAEYLMACMPGCRTARRKQASSTDYDLICSMEGFEIDYRSEFGRYFVCECKDWDNPQTLQRWQNSAGCLIRLKQSLEFFFLVTGSPVRIRQDLQNANS
jgi:hypothetical protein